MSVEKIKELNLQYDWVQIYADHRGEVRVPYYPDAKAVYGTSIELPINVVPPASIITLTQADLKELAEWWAAKTST